MNVGFDPGRDLSPSSSDDGARLRLYQWSAEVHERIDPVVDT